LPSILVKVGETKGNGGIERKLFGKISFLKKYISLDNSFFIKKVPVCLILPRINSIFATLKFKTDYTKYYYWKTTTK